VQARHATRDAMLHARLPRFPEFAMARGHTPLRCHCSLPLTAHASERRRGVNAASMSRRMPDEVQRPPNPIALLRRAACLMIVVLRRYRRARKKIIISVATREPYCAFSKNKIRSDAVDNGEQQMRR